MSLTFSDVEEILRIIDRFPAAEIRFEHGDVKLYVKRAAPTGVAAPNGTASPAPPAVAASAPVAPPPSPVALAPVAQPPPSAVVDVDRSGQTSIESPLAGVFYEAPAPGADPFVRAGQKVAAGTELCIIEVMKVMNTIKAPVAGTIVDVVAPNAAAVDRGQPLMWIRPE